MVKVRQYLDLVKHKQTALLAITGWAAYSSAACPVTNWRTEVALVASLFLVISGCTMFNMVLDQDLDKKMDRTCRRPLPSGQLSTDQVLALGITVSVMGLGWAFTLDALYGWIVSAGFLVDLVIYTFLLKRYTPFSVVFGGIAGGMPALAGRTLGIGHIDLVGVLLAMAILLWIPTHIITFNIRYREDYQRASVPTLSSEYGVAVSRAAIALSTVLAGGCMVAVALLLSMKMVCLMGISLLSAVLSGWAVLSVVRPSPSVNYGLFKAASAYMMATMMLIGLGI